jgi:hypothetical protein
MAKYRDIPMSVRIDKIGELLAKGVYLYLQKQKEVEKSGNPCDNNNSLEKSDPSGSGLGESKPQEKLH